MAAIMLDYEEAQQQTGSRQSQHQRKPVAPFQREPHCRAEQQEWHYGR